ncbi:hypothetical protein Pcinc_028135 [Petrolisthes cinctipes]|uniref:Uncharacterized protein n=1 Tax=Petrolisthes cinctipes TaxID=88211 RepID=A0AAE1F3P5_PETCI|nr:hypothetical protein Pcinc_028135 [Petrolisthes cinctipes]
MYDVALSGRGLAVIHPVSMTTHVNNVTSRVSHMPLIEAARVEAAAAAAAAAAGAGQGCRGSRRASVGRDSVPAPAVLQHQPLTLTQTSRLGQVEVNVENSLAQMVHSAKIENMQYGGGRSSEESIRVSPSSTSLSPSPTSPALHMTVTMSKYSTLSPSHTAPMHQLLACTLAARHSRPPLALLALVHRLHPQSSLLGKIFYFPEQS